MKANSLSQLCPSCKHPGKTVDLITVKSLLVADALREVRKDASYHFCSTKNCDVVYYSDQDFFSKSQVNVRVFQKEDKDPLMVCYCFCFSREKIVKEIERTGKSTAVEEISRYVSEGKCACEIKNPQGTCCLANVAQVVKKI